NPFVQACRQIIDADHLMAFLHKLTDQEGTEKACCAGYEDTSHASSSLPSAPSISWRNTRNGPCRVTSLQASSTVAFKKPSLSPTSYNFPSIRYAYRV